MPIERHHSNKLNDSRLGLLSTKWFVYNKPTIHSSLIKLNPFFASILTCMLTCLMRPCLIKKGCQKSKQNK